MSAIRLLAIDLDGTLVGPTNEYFLCMDLQAKMNEFLAKTGAKWAICTGRSRSGFRIQFRPLLELGIRPDFVVTRDTYLFTVSRRGWLIPHLRWNLYIHKEVLRRNARVQFMLGEWNDLFSKWDFGITNTIRTKRKLIFHFESANTAERVFKLLQTKAQKFPQIRVRRAQDAVWAEADINSKGLAVKRLSLLTGVRPDQILAIGDGRNDISMMRPEVAAMTGCPRNAKPEVVELVHENGGHIARARNLAGAIEVLDAYLTGTVCSNLPPDWAPPGVPTGGSGTGNEDSWHMRYVVAFLIIAIVLGILTLVVFFYFGLLSNSHH
jgi:HAD superfamily hydrolase (TIGR01484 family)